MDFLDKTFTNANQEVVPYDGSPIAWRVSAYVLIVQDQQLLLIKHQEEKLCDIVGGGIEFGETIEDALHREALEEAGAKVIIGPLLHASTDWFYHRKGDFYQTLQLFYLAELDGEMRSPDEPEIEWRKFVPFAEVGTTYRLPPIVEEVIKTCNLK